jgi:drug/metabolite transporter (DMT)-like permease
MQRGETWPFGQLVRVGGQMSDLALGALAAVTASALFSAGLVLQSLEARTVPASHSLRLSLIGRLLGRRRWVLGGLLMVAGFGFHVGALLLAPLTVVQPSLAAGLVVLLVVGARSGGEPIRSRELLAVTAITLGVVGLTLSAPERTTVSAGSLALAVGLGALGAVALVPHALAVLDRRHRQAGSLVATIGAGAAYSLTGLTTKLISDRIDANDWLGAALWLALTIGGAMLALVDQTTALQRRGATQVGVIIYVMPVVVPVVLAPLLVGETWGSSAVPLILSVAAVCAGAGSLSGSRHVSTLEEASRVRW